MGRRSKLSPEVQEKVISAIKAGNYASVAAAFAGISERSFYRWLQRGQEAKSGKYRQFWQAVKKAESEAEVRAVAIIQRHMDNNWQAAMTFLERKFPDKWGRRDRLRLDINPRDELQDLLALSGDELEAAIEVAARSR